MPGWLGAWQWLLPGPPLQRRWNCGIKASPAGGDPGGVRQQALRSISVAVPSDAQVQNHSAAGSIWSSCDGRPDTQGWSDVINDYQFTSARSAAMIVAGVATN